MVGTGTLPLTLLALAAQGSEWQQLPNVQEFGVDGLYYSKIQGYFSSKS
jgi:hypothetical protein